MAVNLAELGRLDAARRFAEVTLTVQPADDQARRVRAFCERAGAKAP